MTDKTMADDELLCAWLDGELSPGEVKRVEERLAAEPALARRLEQMREADRRAQRAFHAIDGAPMPPAVLELLKDDGAERPPGDRGAKVVDLRPRAPRFFQVPVAIAASVALVAGFLVHDLIAPPSVRDDAVLPMSGIVAQESGLHRTLEMAPSAEPVRLPGGGSAAAVLTFRAEDGDWCRQFRLQSDVSAVHGLACRESGGWRVETASFAAPGTPGGPYQQASGATPAALEAAIRARLGPGNPLGHDEEIQLISVGWAESR